LTCTGFSSYVGPGVVNGYVEEKWVFQPI
jgi:hypothetical protein